MKTGYKVLGMDMEASYGDGMIYELNEDYTISGYIECRSRGYHYFESLRDCMVMYDLDKSRVFECVLEGDKFEEDGIAKCTNHIRLTKEVTREDIDKYIQDNLDELVNDHNKYVREELAKQGYRLDILINDEEWIVRRHIARQGYGLDILINDEDWHVRVEVAKQGYGLDILINDKDWQVRRVVAQQGYGLDILVNDENEHVRSVAMQV